MFTTLDAKPQEWMQGDATVLHTVVACSFVSPKHAEHWIDTLIPRNKNGEPIKWAGGRRKNQTRDAFIAGCIKYVGEIDFKITCVSSTEDEMSWFAWAYYFPNRNLITQRTDPKGRNCLDFKVSDAESISFPVLRAGYLIWYHHVIRYLVDGKGICGKFLSDNFSNDEVGPGAGKARGVAFVNWLLNMRDPRSQISLPTIDRFRKMDLLSDHFCGLANSIWSGTATDAQVAGFKELEQSRPDVLESIQFATDLKVVDENGADVTAQVKAAVVNGSVDG